MALLQSHTQNEAFYNNFIGKKIFATKIKNNYLQVKIN